MELLNKGIISKYVSTKNIGYLKDMEIFDSLPSTNTYLAETRNSATMNPYTICLAESQSAGKGRMGKGWISPFGCNIYLSVRYRFIQESVKLSGLSLAIAAAITETLKSYGIVDDIALRWPNDVLWKGRKLSGILIELFNDGIICNAIIGIGLNVNMPQESAVQIEQPWCSIAEIINGIPERNRLAGLLIDHVLATLSLFQKSGLRPFLRSWKKLDSAYGKKVTLITPQSQKITGIGRGVDIHGNFLVEDCEKNIKAFSSAEVSLSKHSMLLPRRPLHFATTN